MKPKLSKLITFALLTMLTIIIFLFFLTALSKVKLEGRCKVDGISFNLNETKEENRMENLNLSNGEIDCNFKIETPLWIVLVAR